ncbi:baseplate J/gp47 family protein [Gluconobacter morbifer]|uniref:Uncharacterized protein n=1 Tax=Gluconobacter morbifer G707 TaxID=1088869 RepID=G6XKW1_9PROT|nr:baseplate J/gp47 family protein [Gluconobacter morbifer]EHH67556.1 hypothetical protein GMO_21270 [Gluconobacter morbifer G707]
MSASIPTPATLAQRFATALAAQQFTASDGTTVTLDATAPATLESALAILSALTDYEIYLYTRDQLLELMVTTATAQGKLPDHGQIWKRPRLGATAAVGYVVVTATQDVSVPAGTLLTADGSVTWSVNSAIEIVAGASVSVFVTCTSTGETGNLSPNTAVALVSPLAGISTLVVDQDGLAGGAEIEGVESWRARILKSIRNPPGSGTVSDYEEWVAEATGNTAIVRIEPRWQGNGTVGVFIAYPGGVLATDAQVQTVSDYIADAGPVTATVYCQAARKLTQDVAVRLNPDTLARRQAVTSALQTLYAGSGIGNTIYREQIESAIISAGGSKNDLVSPTGDLVPDVDQFVVMGVLDWGSPS